MSITYKDISQLSQKSTVAGTEKIPVSDTEYITPAQIASSGGGGVSGTGVTAIVATDEITYAGTQPKSATTMYVVTPVADSNWIMLDESYINFNSGHHSENDPGDIYGYGFGFDISDVENNPPRLLLSNGTQINSFRSSIAAVNIIGGEIWYADGGDNCLVIELIDGKPRGWYYMTD